MSLHTQADLIFFWVFLVLLVAGLWLPTFAIAAGLVYIGHALEVRRG